MSKKQRKVKPKNEVMDRNDFVRLVRCLAETKGMNPSDIVKAIGNNPNNRKRETIANELTNWLKEK